MCLKKLLHLEHKFNNSVPAFSCLMTSQTAVECQGSAVDNNKNLGLRCPVLNVQHSSWPILCFIQHTHHRYHFHHHHQHQLQQTNNRSKHYKYDTDNLQWHWQQNNAHLLTPCNFQKKDVKILWNFTWGYKYHLKFYVGVWIENPLCVQMCKAKEIKCYQEFANIGFFRSPGFYNT